MDFLSLAPATGLQMPQGAGEVRRPVMHALNQQPRVNEIKRGIHERPVFLRIGNLERQVRRYILRLDLG